jgi:hypothetical protein
VILQAMMLRVAIGARLKATIPRRALSGVPVGFVAAAAGACAPALDPAPASAMARIAAGHRRIVNKGAASGHPAGA